VPYNAPTELGLPPISPRVVSPDNKPPPVFLGILPDTLALIPSTTAMPFNLVDQKLKKLS
jgi:hypothetical protein